MHLTHHGHSFILEDGNFHEIKRLFEDRDSWLAINPDDYSTQSLKAAARFRHLADEKAEKIFKRTFGRLYDAPSVPLPNFLDPHQKEGIKWILTRSRSYIAHAPGAGKTCEAIVASLMAKGVGRTVFIVPPTLTKNWEREIQLTIERVSKDGGISWPLWPSIGIVPVTSKASRFDWRAEFLIVPDSMLTKPWVLAMLLHLKIRFIAVDEASRFKEPTSKRTIALFGGSYKYKEPGKDPIIVTSRGLIQDAVHAVLLDGSPMPNRPMELWAPTYAMSPESIDCMEQNDFGLKYCGATINDFGKYEFKRSSNEDDLRMKLRKTFMHVVTEDELSHPERLRSLLIMNQDPRSKDMKTWEQKHLSKFKLKDIDESASQGDIATYRRELGLKKISFVAAYAKERLESNPDESLLLFAWHRDVCEELCTLLRKYKSHLVMGGTKAQDREASFSSFQNGVSRVIVGNISAMGRGHNLQRATRVLFAEYSWTDELNRQCEKRASRKGSANPFVRCEYVVVPNSVDEMILNSVFNKQKTVRRIIG